MMNADYLEYLRSPEWNEKRKAVWRRANGKCERCGRRKEYGDGMQFEVHHLTYERLYNELLSDLQLLCRQCHQYVGGHSQHDPCEVNILRLYAELYGIKHLARMIWKCTPADGDLFCIVQML